MSIYNNSFYINQVNEAHTSASLYCEILSKYLIPSSVVDVGCGRGPWLKAFNDLSIKHDKSQSLTGIDGPWNSKDDLILSDVDFIGYDLNTLGELNLNKRYDVAISVETAEHIEKASTSSFIKNICTLSDVVIFSAAFTTQGVIYHINERLHSEWADFFILNDFSVYDIFRPFVWGNKNVKYWYQQNVFLYVKNNSEFSNTLAKQKIFPVENLLFMDAVHPLLFSERLSYLGVSKYTMQVKLPPSLIVPLSNLKSSIQQFFHGRR